LTVGINDRDRADLEDNAMMPDFSGEWRLHREACTLWIFDRDAQ